MNVSSSSPYICNPIYQMTSNFAFKPKDFTPVEQNHLHIIDQTPENIKLSERFELDRSNLNKRSYEVAIAFENIAATFEGLVNFLSKYLECYESTLDQFVISVFQTLINAFNKYKKAIFDDIEQLPEKFQACGTVGLEYLAGANCAACDANFDFYDANSPTLMVLDPMVCIDIQNACSPLLHAVDDLYQNMMAMAFAMANLDANVRVNPEVQSLCENEACDADLCNTLPSFPLFFAFNGDLGAMLEFVGDDLPYIPSDASCSDLGQLWGYTSHRRETFDPPVKNLHVVLADKITSMANEIANAHSIERRLQFAKPTVFGDNGIDVVAIGKESTLDTKAESPENSAISITFSTIFSVIAISMAYVL
eukprot:Awhi_evm2s12701